MFLEVEEFNYSEGSKDGKNERSRKVDQRIHARHRGYLSYEDLLKNNKINDNSKK